MSRVTTESLVTTDSTVNDPQRQLNFKVDEPRCREAAGWLNSKSELHTSATRQSVTTMRMGREILTRVESSALPRMGANICSAPSSTSPVEPLGICECIPRTLERGASEMISAMVSCGSAAVADRVAKKAFPYMRMRTGSEGFVGRLVMFTPSAHIRLGAGLG